MRLLGAEDYYNTTVFGPIKCYANEFYSLPVDLFINVCAPCDDLECVSGCSGGNVLIREGWASRAQLDKVSVSVDGTKAMVSPLLVLQCDLDAVCAEQVGENCSCVGGNAQSTTDCLPGHLGVLRGECLADHTKSSREHECRECHGLCGEESRG